MANGFAVVAEKALDATGTFSKKGYRICVQEKRRKTSTTDTLIQFTYTFVNSFVTFRGSSWYISSGLYCIKPGFLQRQLHLPLIGDAQMLIGGNCDTSAPGGAGEEAQLHQIGLVHILQRYRFFPDGGSQSL